MKDFKTHGFVTSSTENGYSNFETVKISEESNLHTLSVSDSVKIFLKTGQYFILCKKKSFWSIFLQFFDPVLKICIFWMENNPIFFRRSIQSALPCLPLFASRSSCGKFLFSTSQGDRLEVT